MQFATESPPLPNVPILCRDPFRENKRALVTPARVESLLILNWNKGQLIENKDIDINNNMTKTSSSSNSSSNIVSNNNNHTHNNTNDTGINNNDEIERKALHHSLTATRSYCINQLNTMREDHIRGLNPTPYKISVSQELYNFLHALWAKEAPVAELS